MKKTLLITAILTSCFTASSYAATLHFNDQSEQLPNFQFFTKGADVATNFSPITKDYNVPNAPGKSIPVNTNMQVNSCTDTSCTTVGYPGASVGWSATSYNGQYSFWYGADSTKWSYQHKGLCLHIDVDGQQLPTCCSNSSEWTNCHSDNVNFTANSTITVTLTNQ